MPDDAKDNSSDNKGGDFLAELQAAADHIRATIDDIKKIADGIDALSGRSVVCEIDNVSGSTLRFDTAAHDHGGFAKTLPEFAIADQKNSLFAAQSSGLLTGVEGRAFYTIDDGSGTHFTIHWNNPEVGSNGCDVSLADGRRNRYIAKSITGSGNTAAQMRFLIGLLKGPFSLRSLLPKDFFTPLPDSVIPKGLSFLKIRSVRAFMQV